MENTLHVCLLPVQINWGEKSANLEMLQSSLSGVHPATDMVILPEMFSTGFITDKEKDYIASLAEDNEGETISLLKRLAEEHNFAIAGSFIASDSEERLYNRAFFVEPCGDVVFADKKHLFTMAREDDIFTAGSERLSVRYRGWNIAMIVCYDVRFPVWCRNVDNGYDLLIAVANWPVARVDAWDQLLRARAIENEAYVCGVNCRGTDFRGNEYDGLSRAYDFKGKEKVTVDPKNGFIYTSLSLEKLNKFREKFPAWRDADKFTLE